jgi:hypothetical protein
MPVRKLFALRMREGPEVRANVFFDHEEGEAVLEISVRACQAEHVVAARLGEALRVALDKAGATELALREG